MSFAVQTVLDAVLSHALSSGHFERVNGHEPKNSPGNGLSAAVWAQSLGPARGSGLHNTSGRLVINLRVYSNMVQEPQDAIDPAMLGAVDALMDSFSNDFELGGNIRNIDLLGMSGTAMTAEAGYQSISGTMYRVMTIVIPLILNDVWSQNG
jgi:hypothetical protein